MSNAHPRKKISKNKFLTICELNHQQFISLDTLTLSNNQKVEHSCNECKAEKILNTRFNMLKPIKYLKEKDKCKTKRKELKKDIIEVASKVPKSLPKRILKKDSWSIV